MPEDLLGDLLRDKVKKAEIPKEDSETLWQMNLYDVRTSTAMILYLAEDHELHPLAEIGERKYSKKFYVKIFPEVKMSEEKDRDAYLAFNKIVIDWSTKRKITGVAEMEYDSREHRFAMTVKLTW